MEALQVENLHYNKKWPAAKLVKAPPPVLFVLRPHVSRILFPAHPKAVSFLWHFPSDCSAPPLAGTVPGFSRAESSVRTFLIPIARDATTSATADASIIRWTTCPGLSFYPLSSILYPQCPPPPNPI